MAKKPAKKAAPAKKKAPVKKAAKAVAKPVGAKKKVAKKVVKKAPAPVKKKVVKKAAPAAATKKVVKKAVKKVAASKDGAPVKKKVVKRVRTKEVRLKAFWGVFNQTMRRVAVFEFGDRKEADKKADDLTKSGKSPHFVQLVKEQIVD